ncbi:DUF6221 family protein [Streptomyces sp. NPDC053493]|uniref:DUF6221 family protein n=1 Tax=Streptomyces sp. NPDC053493 TaxID=3365705 RepID=UPI0037CEC12F
MDLVEFLNVRYDEEAAPVATPAWHEPWCQDPWVDPARGACFYCGEQEDPTKVDYVQQSPKTLADIDSKRRIVGGIAPAGPHDAHIAGTFTAWDVLKLLALPYVGHPDYDEAWRP